jgi:hypothetical protein
LQDRIAGRRTARAISLLEIALASNRDDAFGSMTGERVFAVERGPSGVHEALVFVDVRDLAVGCVYGHVRRTPKGGFAALMLKSRRYVSAPCPLLLFRRFDHWTRERLDFTPLRVSLRNAERSVHAPTFEIAVAILCQRIADHSPDLGWFDEQLDNETAIDMGPLEVFSPAEALSSDPKASPSPPAALRAVSSCRLASSATPRRPCRRSP